MKMKNDKIKNANVIGGIFSDMWAGIKKHAPRLAMNAWKNRDKIFNAVRTGLDAYRAVRGGEIGSSSTRYTSNVVGAATPIMGAGLGVNHTIYK